MNYRKCVGKCGPFMNRRYIPLGIISLLLMSVVAGAKAGMFDFMKIYLFSEIGGVVTMDGKPVADAKVERITKADKDYLDKTVTDASGRFHFKAITEHSIKKLFGEPAISQELYFLYKGKKYLGWEHLKNDYDKNGETDDYRPLIDLKCELDKKPVENDQPISGPITGVCVWKRK